MYPAIGVHGADSVLKLSLFEIIAASTGKRTVIAQLTSCKSPATSPSKSLRTVSGSYLCHRCVGHSAVGHSVGATQLGGRQAFMTHEAPVLPGATFTLAGTRVCEVT